MSQLTQRIKFRRNIDIGSIAAENDSFLETCFFDNGDIACLQDMKDPRRIILGRTGTGKTAIIKKLRINHWNIITIDPEALSLQYLSNSTILQALNGLGVHLDLFYKLLWKHIFTVELIKRHYKLEDEDSQKKFLASFFSYLGKNKKKRKAIEYLIEWTGSFFETTEYRIKEITEKLENKVSGEMNCYIKGVGIRLSNDVNSDIEKKGEIIKKAQDIVNSIQIVELNDLINLMETDIFTDPQKKYLILIDDLDKNWVDQSIVYDLIKALLDTVNDFSHKIKYIKIIVALRENILYKILRSQNKRGPQREKYEPLYLQLFWTPEELIQLIDLRIDQLYTGKYSSSVKVSHKDILPNESKHRASGIDYMLRRTFLRPRDIIHFFNISLEKSVGKTEIDWSAIKAAELDYSRSRLESLYDEWKENYPLIDKVFKIFKDYDSPFTSNQISDEIVRVLIDDIYYNQKMVNKQYLWIDEMMQKYFEKGDAYFSEIRMKLLNVLYIIGFIGVKALQSSGLKYSYLPNGNLEPEELTINTKLYVHPAFHRALNIRPTELF